MKWPRLDDAAFPQMENKMTNSLHLKIMAAVERQGEAFDFFVKTNNSRVDSIRDDMSGLQERLEEIEAKASSPGRLTNRPDAPEIKAFERYVRTGDQSGLAPLEGKEMSIGGGAAAGRSSPAISFRAQSPVRRWLAWFATPR
jgi:hypothetical protein